MRSRERLAGFCFQFAQTDFLCVCVSSLSGNSLQTGTSCRNCHFQGKNTLQRRFVPFSFPRAPCAWPRNAPTVPCHSAAPPVLHELGAQRGSSEPGGGTRRGVWQEQARGWVSPALVGQGCADSPALAEAAPDVSPAAHLWLSPSQQQMLPAWTQPASTPHFRTDRLHQAGTSGDICCSLARHLLVLSPQ